jgi:FtsH-binding integral membrane protein
MTTTITTTPTADGLSRDGARALVGSTMTLVALTAAAFAAGAYLARDAAGGVAFASFIASFLMLVALNAAVRSSERVAVGLLLLFGLFLGLGSASSISYYAHSDPKAVWEAGLAAALFVAGFGAAGYATKRDLSGLSRSLLWALVALIAFGIVLVFVQIPGGALVYSIAGLVIFAGLVLLDFQRLRSNDDVGSAPLLAASIFLDVLNVFTLFLPVFGSDER